MKLKYCSITGADDAVRVSDLQKLAEIYPFAEWAILLLPGEESTARCPSRAWIERFSAEYKGHAAMHLCGQALIDFAAGKGDAIMKGFERIQLNLKFGDVEGQYDTDELIARIRENTQHQFIIQYTPDKKKILPLLEDIKNHAILYDASAGRGMAPDAWYPPVPGHFCGYAGGLNPDNLRHHLELIDAAVGDGETWIDMESGVRTNDAFDLDKVARVFEIATPYTK